MSLKYTLQINWGENRGWSETFYTESAASPSSTEASTFARALARARAGCLTNGAVILACRISNPQAPAVVVGLELNLPGVAGNGSLSTDPTDVAALAVLINLYGVNGTRRSFLQRGLTDADVVRGKMTFAYSTRRPYNTFWNLISSSAFAIRNTTNGPFKDITTVSGNGVLTTSVVFAAVEGETVVIKTRSAGNGPKVRSLNKIQSVLGPSSFLLKDWKRGNCEGGQVALQTVNYETMSSYSLSQPAFVRTRQTGHPFGLLRGRQSAKF